MDRFWQFLIAGWKYIVASGGAVLSFLFGGWSVLLMVLFAFAAADYATGWLASAIDGRLNSAIGYKGGAKKIGMFILVGAAHLADTVLGQNHMIRDGAIWYFLGNELLSIIENTGRLGVPIPPVIAQAVEVLRQTGGGHAPTTPPKRSRRGA